MNERTLILLGALALSAGCASHGGANEPPEAKSTAARDVHPPVTAAEQAAVETADETFAFDVYAELTGSAPAGATTTAGTTDTTSAASTANVALSPYSISSALAMTYAGARTTTADQMAAALDFTALDPSTATSESEVPPAFDWLDLTLAANATAGSTPSVLTIANAVWAQKGLPVEEPFLDALAEDFGAGVDLADFEGDPEASREAINAWVDGATNGQIADLIPPGGVNGDTRMALVDAMYFHGTWASAFDPTATMPATFTRLDGSTVMPPMMHEEASFEYAVATGYQLVELGYADGATAMDIVLPVNGTSPAALTQTTFDALVGGMAIEPVILTLPKFDAHGATIDLSSVLTALGMTDAFDPTLADFSGITTAERLFVAAVFHQATVDVDETGTVAAAATAAVLGAHDAAGFTPPPPVTVTVDHPFFFAIRDKATGTILFMGAILDPTA